MKFERTTTAPPVHTPAPADAADIETHEPARPHPVSPRSSGKIKRSSNQLYMLVWFTRQFYLLVSSGMMVVDALDSLARQATQETWKQLLRSIAARVSEGQPLSEAMAAHPNYFDTVYCSLVAAGETGGELTLMLQRLAELTQQQLRVRRAVIGAIIYPTLLLSAASTALSAVMIFVLPRFAEMFDSLGVALPPLTRFLIAIGSGVRSYWYLVIIGIAVSITLGALALRSEPGTRLKNRLSVSMPPLGRIVRNFVTARIARLLGTLLTSHVSVLESLDLVRRSMNNHLYAEMIAKATDRVTGGDSVSSAFADSSLVNVSIYEAVRTGEQSGQVGELLLDVAGFLDEENEASVRALTNILEPLILIVLGLMVGVVAVGLFLPMFDLTANV